MLQNILVIVFVAGALAHVSFSFVKLMVRKKDGQHTCGGCSQCELKKTLVKHGQ